MITFKRILLLLMISIFLTGCWDQNLLKEARLYMSASFDLEPDGRIRDGVTSPVLGTSPDSPSKARSEYVTATGNTPRDGRVNIDKKAPKKFDASKLRIMIIGSELAKQDIYPVLDVFYRDPKSSLSAKIAIAEGRGDEILKSRLQEEGKVSDYLHNLIVSTEIVSFITEENIQSICAELFDPGEDFLLPYLGLTSDNEVQVKGLAMFNERSFTGESLGEDESKMYILMDNQLGKTMRFTKKATKNEEIGHLNFISFDVIKSSSKLKLQISNNSIQGADIKVKMKINISEFPQNKLDKQDKIKELIKKLSQELTKDANRTIKKMQAANCDGLGIGRRLIAMHPSVWESIKWKDDVYPNLPINVKVKVDIAGNGIIN
ncbi:hypothetical protein BK139_19930 [Paenibacillus sp. FSL R5-0490]|uniref:Ger(x)C family spore germination protein n=1 Tax=Bacillales TaxID=1385 RepID=UPI00096C1411|nr:Ger(x)C family spore germination protein [Paenibacillus sp. FSL R5-0490]OMF53992.1 hypothetical protein BK139_19930 [Paenibacillus sp. FSL R5-0490]